MRSLLLSKTLYRHYQFYANLFVSIGLAYALHLWSIRSSPLCAEELWLFLGIAVLEAILFISSRDSLKRTYSRLEQVLA
jgi:hypothetical protein